MTAWSQRPGCHCPRHCALAPWIWNHHMEMQNRVSDCAVQQWASEVVLKQCPALVLPLLHELQLVSYSAHLCLWMCCRTTAFLSEGCVSGSSCRGRLAEYACFQAKCLPWRSMCQPCVCSHHQSLSVFWCATAGGVPGLEQQFSVLLDEDIKRKRDRLLAQRWRPGGTAGVNCTGLIPQRLSIPYCTVQELCS